MTDIYHITHVKNLPRIVAEGGLWCDSRVAKKGLATQSVAHQHIKERRARKVVTCGPGGVVADYVPFYFAPRSPMLYAIHSNAVVGYDGGQDGVVHLVSSVEKIVEAELEYVFTDGHAEMALSKFFADVGDLDKVDWKVMPLTWWNDTREDPDRKRRRQAEFLVREFVPFECFTTVGVSSAAAQKITQDAFADLDDGPTVLVKSGWYY